jgi:hypothetical protein
MLAKAIDDRLDVVFGGDFGDHGSRMSRLEADFKAFRDVRRELRFEGRPVFVRGNHDYGFTDQRLEELTGGCRVASGLAYHHDDSGVTVCHGHIFGLARTVELIRSAESRAQLFRSLTEEVLDEELKPSVIAYDIANMIEAGLARHGLRGLSTAWEGVFHIRAMLAEQILKMSRSSSDSDEATWKMIAGLVGTHDNVEVAGLLGAACHGWASLFGHTHEAFAKRIEVPAFGGRDPAAQVVGNSGHINTKHPTCAVAKFPEVHVYQFDFKSRRLRPRHHANLTDSDIRRFIRSDSARPVPMEIRPAMTNERVVVRPSAEAQAAGAAANQDRLPM